MMKSSQKNKDINIAVIGKSAAGKSAFIKSFSNFPDLINSEGTGQTTRSYAEYRFLVREENVIPQVNVKLMTKEEFVSVKCSQAFRKIKKMSQEQKISFEWLNEQYNDDSYKEEIDTIIIHADDFFNIDELSFLDNNVCVEKLNDLYNEFVDILNSFYTQDSSIKYNCFSKEAQKNVLMIMNRYYSKEYTQEYPEDDIESREESAFENLLRVMYEEMYEIIISTIKKVYINTPILSEKNNILYFDFEISSEYSEILGLFLKVVKEEESEVKKSFTGIVSKVKIISRIADAYLEVLKHSDIRSIILVDTYGLDHDKILDDTVLKERYNRIFNVDYPDITTVFFIEALHQGASNDFINSIKVLYSQRPDIMTYIIGTYIDEHSPNILDKNREWLLSEDKYIDGVQIPELNGKAIDFIYKKVDILNTLKKNNVYPTLAKKRIEVMRKRFGVFCGKILEESEQRDLFKEINAITIGSIFNSIVDREHLGDGYIDINKILSTIDKSESIDKILRYMIGKITERFSYIYGVAGPRTKWRIRTNLEKYKLGFTGNTLDATWFRVFNDAYNESFTKQIKLDGKFTCLSDEFGCAGNEKIAFDELLNTYFPLLFARKCENGNNLSLWQHELSCIQCSEEKEFNPGCLWGIIINAIGKSEFNNRYRYDTVASWLCNMHNLKSKVNDQFYMKLKELFIENMKEKFVPLCREHNARIAGKRVKKEKNDYVNAKAKIIEEYITKYDNQVDKGEFLALMNR